MCSPAADDGWRSRAAFSLAKRFNAARIRERWRYSCTMSAKGRAAAVAIVTARSTSRHLQIRQGQEGLRAGDCRYRGLMGRTNSKITLVHKPRSRYGHRCSNAPILAPFREPAFICPSVESGIASFRSTGGVVLEAVAEGRPSELGQ